MASSKGKKKVSNHFAPVFMKANVKIKKLSDGLSSEFSNIGDSSNDIEIVDGEYFAFA